MENENATNGNAKCKSQKACYRRNKKKLNAQRVLLNCRKKCKVIDSFDKMEKFEKHKQMCLKLHLLDRDLMVDFLNPNVQRPKKSVTCVQWFSCVSHELALPKQSFMFEDENAQRDMHMNDIDNSAVQDHVDSISVLDGKPVIAVDCRFFTDVLPTCSDECWAKPFHDLNKDAHVCNQEHEIWFFCDENNITKSCKKEAPVFLNNQISTCSQHVLKTEFAKIGKDKKCKAEHPKNFRKVGSNAFSKNIIAKLMKCCNDEDTLNKMDKNENPSAFKDCVRDLETKSFGDAEKKDFVSNHIEFKLEPKRPIKQEVRKDTLDFIFGMQETQQDALFLPKSSANSLFCDKFGLSIAFLGSGGNGKGVPTALHQAATSKHCNVVSSQFLTTKCEANAPNGDLHKRVDERLVVVDEPEENEGDKELSFNASFLKKIADDDTASCGEMHDTPVEFLADFSIFCSCNNAPKLDKVDDSVKRRFLNIQFPFQFKEKPDPKNKCEKKRDCTLKDEFRNNKEHRGEHIKLLLERVDVEKSNPPEKALKFTNDHLNDNNHTSNFVEENYEKTDDVGDGISHNDICKHFESWSPVHVSKSNFKKQMLANKFLFGEVRGKFYFEKLMKKEDDEEEVDVNAWCMFKDSSLTCM
eukprot:jgi/Bigna1/144147/aug1.84_g18855